MYIYKSHAHAIYKASLLIIYCILTLFSFFRVFYKCSFSQEFVTSWKYATRQKQH